MLAANGATGIAAGRSKSPVDLPPETAREPSTSTYIRADVENGDDVSRLLHEIKARHGRLDAIVHAAGILRDVAASRKRVLAKALSVIAPKARGFRHSRGLTPAEEDLDLFIMFSSLRGGRQTMGPDGLHTANGFLDGFAERWREALRAKGRSAPAGQSHRLAPVERGGMQVHPDAAAMYRWLGMRPMATSDGRRSPKRLPPRKPVVAVAGDAGKIRAAWLTGGKPPTLQKRCIHIGTKRGALHSGWTSAT